MTYVNINEVSDLLDYLPFDTTILSNLPNSKLEVFLSLASRKLDSTYIFKGVKLDDNQFLEFPRTKLEPHLISDIIPLDVKLATLALTYKLVKAKSLLDSSSDYVKREKLGRTLEREYFGKDEQPIKDKNDFNLIEEYLKPYIRSNVFYLCRG